MNRPALRGLVALSSLVVLILVLPAAPALAVGLCSDQFGTTNYDSARAIANDGTNFFVGGISSAALPGQTFKGVHDLFVRRYDSSCAVSWTREFGTKSDEYVRGLAADGSGRAFVVGDTYGKFKGQTLAGDRDALVRAYSPAGKVLWTDEFGTAKLDIADGICVSGTKVIVAGQAGGALPGQHYAGGGADVFVRAYKASTGKVLWTHEFGTKKYDSAPGVAANGGSVFVTGSTGGALPGQSNAGLTDSFVRKYSASGAAGFTTEFGTAGDDDATGIAADGSGEVVVGATNGSFPTFTNLTPGVSDGFVYAMNGSGANVWTQQFGTASYDVALALVISDANVYVTGDSTGGLGEASYQGNGDMFVGWMNRTTGSVPAFAGYGTSGGDNAFSITASGGAVVWPAGDSSGPLAGSNIGDYDAYFFACCS